MSTRDHKNRDSDSILKLKSGMWLSGCRDNAIIGYGTKRKDYKNKIKMCKLWEMQSFGNKIL